MSIIPLGPGWQMQQYCNKCGMAYTGYFHECPQNTWTTDTTLTLPPFSTDPFVAEDALAGTIIKLDGDHYTLTASADRFWTSGTSWYDDEQMQEIVDASDKTVIWIHKPFATRHEILRALLLDKDIDKAIKELDRLDENR